ncbi:MAG: hypothetical protein GY737_28795 [Desulfobacteraceae bacterium]|nr:hypothetical protein [Desulfobacteraceae bacterium]
MRISLAIACFLLLIGTFVLLVFHQVLWPKKAVLIERNGGVIVEQSDCYTSLMRAEDGTTLYRENTCRDDGELWKHLASNTALARKLFDGADRLYLGRTRFSEGPFLVCNVLARLREDHEWTPDINSLEAATVLERILPEAKLVPSAYATFVNVGKSLKSVSLEVVLLNGEGTLPHCTELPEKIPTSAVVDIALGTKSAR